MTFKVTASDSFAWVADRLPDHQYKEMIAEIQAEATRIAEKYGLDYEVGQSFGVHSALKFERN